MDNQNTDLQLIDQYLDGTLSDEQLNLFNDKIQSDEAFREAVVFQTSLRKSVRAGKVDQWKKEWEANEKDKKRFGWWIWPIGIGLIGLLTFILLPYFGGQDDATIIDPVVSDTIPSSTPNPEDTTKVIDPIDPVIDPTPPVIPPSKRREIAALDLRDYSRLDNYPPIAIIRKSSNDPKDKRWALPKNENSLDSLRQLKTDLSAFLDSDEAPEDAAKYQLLLGYLQFKTAEYSSAERSLKAILQSEAFEVHGFARWYLVLDLVKQNKGKEAERLLNIIINYPGGGHFMREAAEELRKEIGA